MIPSPDPENRMTRVTPYDHAAYIWLATLHSLAYAFCFLGFRIVVKRDRYSIDDLVLSAGYVAALTHWACCFVALNHQLGKSLSISSELQREIASKALFASRIFLVAALTLSKVSVVTLIRHIFTQEMRKAWRSCNYYVAAVVVWGVMSIILLSAGCSSTSRLEMNQNEQCPNQNVRWILFLVLDALTECGMLVLICWLLSPLTMRKRLKALVVAAFSFRIPVAVFSVGFLVYTLRSFRSSDPALAIAIPIVWQELLLCYSLISATLPCLRSFMKSFQTGGLVYVTSLGKMGEALESQRSRSQHSPPSSSRRRTFNSNSDERRHEFHEDSLTSIYESE